MKIFKIALISVGVVILLAIAGLVVVAANVDPNQYKPELIDLVKTRTGRTLKIEGPLSLSFFPKLGISIGTVELSEAGGAKPFAKVGEVRASLAILPLLSRQIVVDRVVVAGLTAAVVRHKDGRTNIDDLASGGKEQPAAPSSGASVKLDIAGVEVGADSLGWSDERDGTKLHLTGVKLTTGRIADNTPGKVDLVARIQGDRPKLDINLSLTSGYRFTIESKAIVLDGLTLKVTGDVPGAAGLTASVRGSLESDPSRQLLKIAGIDISATTKDGIDAKLSVPGIEISPDKAVGAKASGSLKVARPGLSLDAKMSLSALQASLRSAAPVGGPTGGPPDGGPKGGGAAATGAGRVLNFSGLEIDFSSKQGDTAIQGRIATPLLANLDTQVLRLASLNGELVASGPAIPQKSVKAAVTGLLEANWAKQSGFGNLVIKLDDSTIKAKFDLASLSGTPAIGFDIDIDQLNLDRFKSPAGPAPAGTPPQTSAAAEKPIDLSVLKTFNAKGQLRAGRLVASNVKIEKLAATLRANGGRLDINPLNAGLYGGALAGVIGVNANANQFSVRQQLSGVNIGPLLRDVLNKDFIDGRGNVAIDIETSGQTVTALKRSLNGSAGVNLRDGAIKGINLAESFRKAKSLLGAKGSQEQAASKADQTDFAELTANFQIRNGVAHNEDLSLKSPFLRLGGAGNIDIGKDSVDYLAKVSIVSTSGGQGSKDLSDLRGLTIPVRLSGPFEALKYNIDYGAVATEAVKQQVQEKVKEQLQDRLKGLLKR